MIRQADITSIFLFLMAVFLSAVAQVLLKKAALSEHTDLLHEYLDWRVILGYAMMFGCTLVNVAAYRGIPLSMGMMLETTSYIYVTLFGAAIFMERITWTKILALGLILCGNILYAA